MTLRDSCRSAAGSRKFRNPLVRPMAVSRWPKADFSFFVDHPERELKSADGIRPTAFGRQFRVVHLPPFREPTLITHGHLERLLRRSHARNATQDGWLKAGNLGIGRIIRTS